MIRIKKVLSSARFIKGEEVNELEGRLKEFVGINHCIAVGNGTDALQIALMALGIKAGDEVIVPAFSFVATAEAAAILGAKVVYVDVDKKNYNIDASLIEEKINERTRAIIAVSLFGQCADYDEINRLAGKYNIPVIEDAAQSFGARYKGRLSCNLTTIATTSFFPTKPLGCYGDGGAVFTNDDEMGEKIRSIANHGQERRYHHVRIGMNSRLDSMQAAVLLAKMEIFEGEVVSRREAGEYYSHLLGAVGIKTPYIENYNRSVYAQYTVQIKNRSKVQQSLRDAGIPTAIHYPLPLNKQPAVCDSNAYVPVSELLSEQVLSLPMHAHIKKDIQGFICKQLLSAVND